MKLKARSFGIEGTLVGSSAEDIDLPDESADVVVSTLVLCSVKDLSATIREIKRILKKNGRLFFVEHVAAPENTRLRKAQQILNPINRIIADGCNCNRETWRTIENAGFASTNFVHKMIKGTPSIHAPHIIGSATK